MQTPEPPRYGRRQAESLRLDADVIAWLKKDGDGYQMRANQMLRERMLKELKRKFELVRYSRLG